MRHQGRITTWKDDKGFGFITPAGGGERVFVHIDAFSSRQRRPAGNELVTYERKVDEKGRYRAQAVLFAGERPPPQKAQRRSSFAPVFALCFLVLVTGAVLAGRLPGIVLGVYLVTSIVAFFAYALDKSAASRNRWRTRESTLHLFALLGGWPGALAAQRLLRHKSAKTAFQIEFWITVALNCAALGWLLSPAGQGSLESVLGSG